MTQLRTTMTKGVREMRNRPVLVFAGAVLAVVLVVGVTAVLKARSEDPVTGPPPTADTVTTTAPATTLAPQATPPDLDFQSGALEPGTYVITWVQPFEIEITVPEGWQRLRVPSTVWGEANTTLGFVAVDNVYADPCSGDLSELDPPPGPTVDDLVAALAALPGIETTEPRDVTVDGFAAEYVELIGTTEAGLCEPHLWRIPNLGRFDARPQSQRPPSQSLDRGRRR